MKKIICSLFLVFLSFFVIFKDSLAFNDPLSTPNNIYGIGIINYSDLKDASYLVNSTGGDWGYVTIVITKEQRDKNIWQDFFDEARKLHIIPIVRVATKFDGKNWETPNIKDIDSWVNFFNSLNWVIENRYVVIGNEPNHAKEWGGKIDPKGYALYLKEFSSKLKNSNQDYFVLPAGFDQDAPNSKKTMDEKKYISEMIKAVPDNFQFIDGWNSHSYPNPAFSGPKTGTGRRSIRGYEWELEILKSHNILKDLPVFVTETGWVRNSKKEEQIAENLRYAYEEVWMKDKRVVAVTPFILNYTEEPFNEFSWKNKNGSFTKTYSTIQNTQKLKGEPKQKINGEIIFSFLNPLMFRGTEQKAFSIVKNTGQAIWEQSESNVINESNKEISVSNTKFSNIEPFSTGLVVYTLTAPNQPATQQTKLGFYIRGTRIGEVFNGKIISF